MTNSQPTLHFMCGKAGAGKSTVAAKLATAHNAIVLCEDVFLARLFAPEMNTFDDYLRYSKRLKTVIEPLVVDLLLARQSVVLDFPANTMALRHWFRSIFERANVAHQLHFVDTPDHVCLERIAQRNRELPEGAHTLTVEQFNYISSFFEPPVLAEGFTVQTCLPGV